MDTTKVFVYFNTVKKCFSVEALEGDNQGKVIANRDRVLVYKGETLTHNVPSGIVGLWDDNPPESMRSEYGVCWLGSYQLKYNPHKTETFVSIPYNKPMDGYIGLPIELFKNSETGLPTVRVHQVANLIKL